MNDRIHQFINGKRAIKEMRGNNLKGFLVFRAFPEESLGPAQILLQLLMLKSKKYFMLDFVHMKGFLVFRAFPEGSLGPAQIPFQFLMLKSKKYFTLDFVHFSFAKKPARAKA
jgi:hypothetical protein